MAVDGFVVDFSRGCHFEKAWFGKEVDLTLRTRAYFRSAKARYISKVRYGLTVDGFCDFNKSTFERAALFHMSKFDGGASFKGSRFEGNVDFAMASFKKKAEFGGAEFKGYTYFSKVDFGERETGGECFTSFGDCVFFKATRFRETDFSSNYPTLTGAVLHERTYFETDAKFWPTNPSQPASVSRASCAVIRNLLTSQGLPSEAHFFFRREMRFEGKTKSGWAKLPYCGYKVLSDYGYSIARPTGWLFFVWLLGFACLHGYLSSCCAIAPLVEIERPVGMAMGLSFSNLFPLFGLGQVFFGDLLQDLPASLKVLSGFQTVVSLPLLFFLGLGLRTRFRLR